MSGDLSENCLGLLRREVDKVKMSQYFGLECNSDEEMQKDESDVGYFNEDEVTRNVPDYDPDKMFEIVNKRDFNKWSMKTIHHRYTKIHDESSGNMIISRQIFYLYVITFWFEHSFHKFGDFYRMRNYNKRGSVSSRIEYARLREEVWNEVYSLLEEGVFLHNNDVQQIAMIKAKERNLHDSKVCILSNIFF